MFVAYMMSRSTKLAYLLRHDDTYEFTHDGWRTIEDLCENHSYTLQEIIDIVERDTKGRLEFNSDKSCIRAVYGHSVDVFPDLMECPPPDILYHGTAVSALDKIMHEGLKKMSRNHVHLGTDIMEALDVVSRHGAPIVLEIDAAKMRNDGIKFLKARNNSLWLTEHVPSMYISTLKDIEI